MADSGLILITGAAGRIGGRVAELLAHDNHRLRLMTRSSEHAPGLPQAEIVHGDYGEPDTLVAAFAGIDTALIVSGSGEPGKRALQHRNAFEAAARAKVKHIIYLSMQGASENSKYPYSRDHHLSEEFLASRSVPHTILRDAFYIDMFLTEGKYAGFDAQGAIRGPAGNGRAAFVSREDVARTVAAALRTRPEGVFNVTGPEALSVAAVAVRLSELAGRPLHFEHEEPAVMRERLSGQKMEPWQVRLAVGWFEAIGAGELEKVSDTVQRLTGAPPMTVEEYFTRFPQLLLPLKK
jgi:uncharacterized protein YbjT (DUF2867 family)